MSRAVTADHVMFNECISMFRPDPLEINAEGEELVGYLLLDFSLELPLEFNHFSIQPTIEIRLPGAYAAYVAPVIQPKWFKMPHNTHLFTIGLSAVVSFVTGRPIKAPRDGYLTRRKDLDVNGLRELAIQHPILTAGPGNHDTRLSKATFDKMRSELYETIRLLFEMPYPLYVATMQAIRLVHLAHLNHRDDFGLSYYLLVSAMEPIAKTAIKRKSVATQHDLFDKWKEISQSDPEFNQLFKTYQQERSKNQYLGRRLVEFVMRYCPPEQWNELEHPEENSTGYTSEMSHGSHDWSWVTKKKWYEIYPEDLTEEEIRKLISDCYVHRSTFTHEGKNPPHQTPYSSNRFFDKETVVDDKTNEFRMYEVVLPNYRLISFIAKRSIFNYLIEITMK